MHISEEASNAATAVPWAIVLSTAISGILGFGVSFIILALVRNHLIQYRYNVAVNIALTFCMGQDLDVLMGSSLGQPMAQIISNSFGKNGTLVIWSFIVLAQYIMGSSMVCLSFLPPTGNRLQLLMVPILL